MRLLEPVKKRVTVCDGIELGALGALCHAALPEALKLGLKELDVFIHHIFLLQDSFCNLKALLLLANIFFSDAMISTHIPLPRQLIEAAKSPSALDGQKVIRNHQ